MSTTIGDWLARLDRELSGKFGRSSTHEAEIMLEHGFLAIDGRTINRFELHSQLKTVVSLEFDAWVESALTQRLQGIPLQYATGFASFMEHVYQVGLGVLIPRPETEILVSQVQEKLRGRRNHDLLGFECGIGSGIISIELLGFLPRLKMISTEISAIAAGFAQKNARSILKSDHARLDLQSVAPDMIWPSSLTEASLDFIVSNPPYLVEVDPLTDPQTASREYDHSVQKHEPREALFSPAHDPVFFYREFAKQAARFLKPAGFVAVEIPHERAEEIQECFQSRHWAVSSFSDLNSRPRVLIAQLS